LHISFHHPFTLCPSFSPHFFDLSFRILSPCPFLSSPRGGCVARLLHPRLRILHVQWEGNNLQSRTPARLATSFSSFLSTDSVVHTILSLYDYILPRDIYTF
jgi:hypothetical protein